MKFIRPTAIIDARLTSSTAAEDDYPAWGGATAYAVGQRVIRAATHRVYERVSAGTTATAPELDAVNWLDIAPVNRWAMFDPKLGTVTTAANSLTVVMTPGRINSLALLGLDCSTATVTLAAGGSTVYSASFDLDSGAQVGNWYQYFYEPVYQQTELLITDLLDAALLDIPAYGEGVLTVTLSRPGGAVSCAMLVVGIVTDLGETLEKPQVSIRDYSRKEPDGFGNYSLVERDYSKRMSADVLVMRPNVDAVVKTLSRYRATPVVWIGSGSYGCLVIYGFLADWSLVIENQAASKFSAQIEGMT